MGVGVDDQRAVLRSSNEPGVRNGSEYIRLSDLALTAADPQEPLNGLCPSGSEKSGNRSYVRHGRSATNYSGLLLGWR